MGTTKVERIAATVTRFECEIARLRREADKKELILESWRRMLRLEEEKAETPDRYEAKVLGTEVVAA